MKNLLFLLTLILLSCSSSKPKEAHYISVKNLSDTNYPVFASMNTYYADMGIHKFQMNQTEVIYDVVTGKFGLRNTENNLIIQTDFTYLAFLSENFLIAEKDYLNGIIDIKGNVLIPPIYRSINLHGVGTPFFIAQKEGKFGILNANGTELYPFSIQIIKSITTYNDKVYIATDDENYNVRILKIADGVVQIIPSFTSFVALKNNLAAVYYFQNSRAMWNLQYEK